jgi:hypothetical protein
MTSLPAMSRQATLYVVRELGRRAGAAPDWIAKWRVGFQDNFVTLYPLPDSQARLLFPYDPSKSAHLSELLKSPPSRYFWMDDPGTAAMETVRDFVVPFESSGGNIPLFASKGEDTIECQGDILSAALWTMARVEESVPGPGDAHGRFPASESVALRFGYLDRPIVDEYALAFRQALSSLVPGWSPPARLLRLKLSHDIDLVGLPRNLRSTVAHLYPRGIPRAFLRDVLSFSGVGYPAYLQAVLETAQVSREGGYDSAFYWKASGRTPWDSGYDAEHPQVREVIDRLALEGFELGVHPAYGTFGEPHQLEAEVDRLRRVVGSGAIGGRQHFLRWRPSTWSTWERAGLAYDSSVGFADAMGFRAGTAVPYHPWLFEEDRESALIEIPLVVMDCTPVEYMHLGARETLAAIAALVRRCEGVGGVFTLLWHNSSVIEHPYKSLYPRILSLLPSCAHYDWRADVSILPTPRVMEQGEPA